jgi:hypothetical protein
MKKQTLKISLLSFMLLALWIIVFFNNSKAADVDLSLTINAGGVPSCSNTTGITLTSLAASFSEQSQTWSFTPNSWTCTDTRWTARGWSQAMTVKLVANLSAWGWNTISSGNVKMTTTFSTSAWNLTWSSTLWSLTALSSTQDIYRKTTANTIGTFIASPTVVITVPANQTPGTYTWTITVTNPS